MESEDGAGEGKPWAETPGAGGTQRLRGAWPGHQGLGQTWAATLGMAVKAAATNTDEARREYVRNQLAFASQTPGKVLEKHFSFPLK